MSNVTFTSLLTPGSVLFLSQNYGKEEALKLLTQQITKELPKDIPLDTLEDTLRQCGDSQPHLASGLYLAYAKLPELRDVHSVLGIHRQGFSDGGSVPIKAVLVSLTPRSPEFFQKHLDFLSAINYVFTADFVDRLACAPDSQSVYDILSQA